MTNDQTDATGRTLDEQRSIQEQVARADDHRTTPKKGAMQAVARRYPEPPFPKQHQLKPGIEADLDPPPLYDAPFYKGSGKLQDKVAIITGGDSGIGRAVAVLFAREGAGVAILHLDEERDARDTKAAVEAEGRRCFTLSGDVRDRRVCFAAVEEAVARYGKLDVLVNNAAFQVHTADFEDLTEEHFDMTLRTNLYGLTIMEGADTDLGNQDDLIDFALRSLPGLRARLAS